MDEIHRLRISKAHNERARKIYLKKAKDCTKIVEKIDKEIEKLLEGSDKK